MLITKKSTTTTLNIKTSTKQNFADLFAFIKNLTPDSYIENFKVLDEDEDSNYFYYTVVYDITNIYNEYMLADGNEVSARTYIPKKKKVKVSKK
jgi:hypothetical protein